MSGALQEQADARIDLELDGHDLEAESDTVELEDAQEDVSVVARSLLPRDVIADLEGIEYGTLVLKAVVGDDNRTAIKNTKIDPYKTVVKLFSRYVKGGKQYGCSGSLIAPDAVLTSAHCVFNTQRVASGYAYSVTAVPGMYPKSPKPATGVVYEAPFGTASGSKLFVPSKYVSNEADPWTRISHDYAVIRLKSSFGAVGTKLFDVMPSPLNKAARLIGYHGDKKAGLLMYSSSDQVRKVLNNGTFNHFMDSDHGSSGAGITGAGGWENKIFGVNSSEVEGATPYNIATTITSSNRQVIADWAVRPL